MDAAQIQFERRRFVDSIRAYSRSQKSLWKRIPSLALEADGRTGFNDNYSRAYHSGFWALEGSAQGGSYTVYVHLASGELVDAYLASSSFSILDVDIPKASELRPASDEDVLRVASSLDELDAQKTIDLLEKEAREPYLSCYDREEMEQWRAGKRMELNLPAPSAR